MADQVSAPPESPPSLPPIRQRTTFDPRENVGMVSQAEVLANRYKKWRYSSQFLYNFLDNYKVAFPAICCRWGSLLPPQASCHHKQRIYYSERTDGDNPDTLVIATYNVVRSSNSAPEHRELVSQAVALRKNKIIFHPGKVLKIRELPQNPDIVATQSNSGHVFIWDVNSQPRENFVFFGATVSEPLLMLSRDVSALAMCRTEPLVLSGGKDKVVAVWSIEGHKTASGRSMSTPLSFCSGHEDIVEDVAFCPSSAQEFCSVGDDCCLILWDRRVGSTPVHKVEKAHNAYLYCVDWNAHDCNLILTGSADNSIHVFDRRKLVSHDTCFPVHKFEGHKSAVRCVQWSPDRCSVFGTSAEDGLLNIWDYDQVNKVGPRRTPSGLFFEHIGHSMRRETAVDFHWNEHDPWTVISSSDNTDLISSGGILQIWRMSDLVSRSEEELLAACDKLKFL